MVNYAVDVDNPRVVSAMTELGILKEELVVKNLEDFADPHISHNIQKLRYEHYLKLLKESVHDIRELIKSHHLHRPSEYHINISPCYQQPSFTYRPLNIENSKYPYKHRMILQKTLSTFELPKTLSKKHKKPSESQTSLQCDSPETSYKKNFTKYKDLQSQNYKAIQKAQIKAQQDLSKHSQKQMIDHLKREKSLEDLKRQQAKQRDEIFQRKCEEIQNRKLKIEEGLETDIVDKLQRYEDKIKKSEKIHSYAIKAKVEKARGFKEIAEVVQKNIEDKKKSDELEVFRRLVEKHDNVMMHRERIGELTQRSMLEKREKFEKQRVGAMEKIRKSQEEFIERTKSTEILYLNAQEINNNKKNRIQEEMLLRRERKKQKDLECLTKIQRAKRKFDSKNLKSLKKTLEKYQKIDEFKQEREKIIYLNRDNAIKAMIEREKFLEVVALINKSPRSRTAQLKLKSLNYPSKEETLQEVKQ